MKLMLAVKSIKHWRWRRSRPTTSVCLHITAYGEVKVNRTWNSSPHTHHDCMGVGRFRFGKDKIGPGYSRLCPDWVCSQASQRLKVGYSRLCPDWVWSQASQRLKVGYSRLLLVWVCSQASERFKIGYSSCLVWECTKHSGLKSR